MCSAEACQGRQNSEYATREPRHSQARRARIGERRGSGCTALRATEARVVRALSGTGGGDGWRRENTARGTRAVPGRLDREGGAGAECAPWTRENVLRRRGHGASACQKRQGAQTGYHSGAGADWLASTNVQGTVAGWAGRDLCSQVACAISSSPEHCLPTSQKPLKRCLPARPPRQSFSPVLTPAPPAARLRLPRYPVQQARWLNSTR